MRTIIWSNQTFLKLNITHVLEFNSFIRRSVAFLSVFITRFAIWFVTYRDPSSTWITFMNTFFAFIYVDTLAQIIAYFFWIFIILKTINTFAIIGAQSINTFMILTWLYYVQTFVDIQTFISIATIPLNFCGFLNNFTLYIKLNQTTSVLTLNHRKCITNTFKILHLNKTSWANTFIGANSIWAFIWIITKPFRWFWVALIDIDAALILGMSMKSIHTYTFIRTFKIIVIAKQIKKYWINETQYIDLYPKQIAKKLKLFTNRIFANFIWSTCCFYQTFISVNTSCSNPVPSWSTVAKIWPNCIYTNFIFQNWICVTCFFVFGKFFSIENW